MGKDPGYGRLTAYYERHSTDDLREQRQRWANKAEVARVELEAYRSTVEGRWLILNAESQQNIAKRHIGFIDRELEKRGA